MSKKKYIIKTKYIERLIYYIVCPICKKDICGIDQNTLIRNFEKHIEKHKNQEKKK